ncbi:zinc finger protein 653 [Gastrophryne carolinensis]
MAAPVMAAPCSSEEEDDSGGRKVRGRPRLADTDRMRRRLESRKKYDCRRVYLGETHGAWVLRRDKGAESVGGAWTDAKLAAYLLELEARGGTPREDLQRSSPQPKRPQQDGDSSLLSLVSWYCDHKSLCPHEPGLSEVSTGPALFVRAVWQCQAGHCFLQDLHCPVRSQNQRGCGDGTESDDSSSKSSAVKQGSHPDPVEPGHLLYSQTSDDMTEGEDAGTVVCLPMEEGALFDGVAHEALGQVVAAGCPSQVIIIAGSGYEALATDGIQLDVVQGSGEEEGTRSTLEAISALTHTDEEEEEQEGAASLTDDDALYNLQEEQPAEGGHPSLDLHSPLTAAHSTNKPTGLQPKQQPNCHMETAQHALGEPEKKKSRCPLAADADGVLEMFHCPYEGCDQVYTALNSFKNHISLIHRKGRTKVCPEAGCGKKFYLSNHLRRHMIIHTGIREFICETCGKSFKRKSHLEVHRRTHTGETPLQCEVCGYQCRQRASLNWHMKKHGSSIQYNFSCEQCGKLFEKRESVKFHKLKSHPEGGVT